MEHITPSIVIVRAVGALFARRMLRTALLIGVIAAVVLHGVGAWLAIENPWWWLLELVFIFLTLVFVILIVVVLAVLRIVEPRQSIAQKHAVAEFVDKFQRVAENLQMPMPLIVFFVVKDTILPPKDGTFISKMTRDSTSLAPDLMKLHKTFGDARRS